MIEMMLEAERAMGIGLFDNAERLYRQVVELDPKNSIAVTGLARVALERDDQREAYVLARRALAIDPENPVAAHLAHRMAEQLLMRGEPLPDDPGSDSPPPTPGDDPAASPARSGLVDRLLRRRR
ncbi:MAG TPA: tetratricopeptide repeat protein [Candidatus Limnocylindrales bacterium]|jgi:tetratricopeptide (TPR) repeat protein